MTSEERARALAALASLSFIYCPICEPNRRGLIALPCVACQSGPPPLDADEEDHEK
jgi:hypothetical protein